MKMRAAAIALCGVVMVGCPKSGDGEDAAAKPVSAEGGAVASGEAGAGGDGGDGGRARARARATRGSTVSRPGPCTCPTEKDWASVKFKNDDSKHARRRRDHARRSTRTGACPAGPRVGRSARQCSTGPATERLLTATIRRKDPADDGLTGTLVAKVAGDALEGTMKLAESNAAVVRVGEARREEEVGAHVFAPVRYIEWALKFYGKVPFDLASSGIPVASWSELGVPEPNLDDSRRTRASRESLAIYNDVTRERGGARARHLARGLPRLRRDALARRRGARRAPWLRAADAHGRGPRRHRCARSSASPSDGFAISPERVAAAVTSRTRVIVVTNLHNPTGVARRRRDAARARERSPRRAARISSSTRSTPRSTISPRTACSARARASSRRTSSRSSSLTKCYGLGMHRIGWVLGPPEIVERAEAAIIATCGHLPLSHAARGAVAVANVGKLSKRAKAILAGKRDIAAQWAATLPNAQWSAPTSGLFGLVTLRGRRRSPPAHRVVGERARRPRRSRLVLRRAERIPTLVGHARRAIASRKASRSSERCSR